MLNKIDVFEHGRLMIDEKLFTREHWKAFVKLNDAHEGQYFDVLHNGLRFKQFVGVIQVDGLLVQIHPKADKDDDDSKWRNVLLDMLKACGRLKAQTAGNANLKKQHLNLLEVYFEYFLREVETLIHHGFIKKYRKETGNIKALKGKLDFAGNIRHNLVHKERFFTTHQVYDVNHKLHQILALALRIVDQFSKGTRLADYSKRVFLTFPEVNSIQVNEQVLNAIKLDRKSAPYERAFELAKLIILNYSPDINQGNQQMIALLFDMNQLWEEYVFVKLKKEINKENSSFSKYKIVGQVSKRFWSYNKLKPDIVLINTENQESIIIDTKWKRPGNSASVEDLRQMYAYGRFWKAEKLILLYPGKFYNPKFVDFEDKDVYHLKEKHKIDGELKIQNHRCKMANVSVVNEKELNEDLGEKIFELFS